MKKYLALAAGNEFIDRAGDRGVSHMKLQKLVYLSVEKWLKTHDESFINREPEVWQYGPVFPDLYHALKHYKSSDICELQKFFGEVPRIDNKEVLQVIDSVWEENKSVSAVYLSDLTHRPGGPWHTVATRHNFSVPFGTYIPAKVIKDYVRAE